MRMIDADALKKVMIETLEALLKNPKMDNQEAHLLAAFHTVGKMIEDAPTVDAVEVVRCKDCKWYTHHESDDGYSYYLCSILSILDGNGNVVESDEFFCGYGKRKDENRSD